MTKKELIPICALCLDNMLRFISKSNLVVPITSDTKPEKCLWCHKETYIRIIEETK